MTPFQPDPVQEWLAMCTPKVRRIVERARKRILAVVPTATEKLRPGWGLLGYNAPTYFAFIAPGREDVRIGFEWGGELPDPDGVLVGSGSQVRYFMVRTLGDLKAPALTALLREAAAIRPPPRSSASHGARR